MYVFGGEAFKSHVMKEFRSGVTKIMYKEKKSDRLKKWGSGIKTDITDFFTYKGSRKIVDKRDDKRKKDYLAAAVIGKNEGRYLKEFVEFHFLSGVERIYFFDNESEDNTRQVLDPYIEDGRVVYFYCPGPRMQFPAYRKAIRYCKGYTKWLALIDCDEFLFSPRGDLKEVLKDYEDAPAVGVNWVSFGPSGHDKRPEGLVTENYRQTFKERDHLFNRHVKSIVRPECVESINSPHYCRYKKGRLAVDENHNPIGAEETGKKGERFAFTARNSTEKLRINHYITKSLEDLREKGKRGYPDGMPNNVFEESVNRFNVPLIEDDSIRRFIAPLKERCNEYKTEV